MARDPYETLGVSRTATPDDIRKAFRKLAKKNHPDLNPGDKAAEERFKAANTANEILSDPERRARFDRGEIDAAGQDKAPEHAYYRDYAQADAGGRYGPGSGIDPNDLGDIFADFFTARGGGADSAGTRPRRGADRRYRIEVPFLSTVNGATERLTLPDGETLDVRIPPGIEDGQVLRLRGKGDHGRNGGPDGDALIEVGALPSPIYKRQGVNLELDLPVTLAEAVLGAKVPVPTPRGEVTLTVPAHAEAGQRLRLRGRGVAEHGGKPAGDLYVTLRLVAGPPDPELEAALREWKARHDGFDPREALAEAGMITVDIVLSRLPALDEATLQSWIAQDWVRPQRQGGEPVFAEIDVARLHLILTCATRSRWRRAPMPVVLSLLDQLHETRRQMRRLCEALDAAGAGETARDLISRLTAR